MHKETGRKVARRKFKKLVPGPWVCALCGRAITSLGPRHGVVHHVNGDVFDNALSNLRAMHADCHTRHHKGSGTQCQRGHDWNDPRNVYIGKTGRRWCAECSRQRQRAYRA